MMGTPPELESLRSMIRIAKIITLIFMVIALLIGIVAIIALATIGLGVFGGFALVGFVVLLVAYVLIGGVQTQVDQGQYQQAKDRTLILAILGILFGFLLPGIFLLLAYLKFDPVITWQRSAGQGGAPPGWGGAQPGVQAWGQPQNPGWGQPSTGAQPAQPGGWSSPPAAQPAQSGSWSQPVASPQAAPPAMAPTPAAAPAATMCPRCNKPATWVAQYNRWYCYSCAQYV